MGIIKCCLNCSDRYVGCHSECEKYISEKKAHLANKEKIKKMKQFENDINSILAKHGNRR